MGLPATDDLIVNPMTFTKTFLDDPVLPGESATLEFTITNNSGMDDATVIFLNDNLQNMLAGATFDPAVVPAEPCGTGSSIALQSGNTSLTLFNGNLTAGTSCTFQLEVKIPANAASMTYTNTTSFFFATIGGVANVSLPNASDDLTVKTDYLDITKEFTNDPVAPGGTVDLKFTIENTNPNSTVTDITFTDDLDANLPGFAPTAGGIPATPCGAGSMLTFDAMTGVLTLTGGSVAAASNCMFTVTLDVPATVTGNSIDNLTSEVTGKIGMVDIRR